MTEMTPTSEAIIVGRYLSLQTLIVFVNLPCELINVEFGLIIPLRSTN